MIKNEITTLQVQKYVTELNEKSNECPKNNTKFTKQFRLDLSAGIE